MFAQRRFENEPPFGANSSADHSVVLMESLGCDSILRRENVNSHSSVEVEFLGRAQILWADLFSLEKQLGVIFSRTKYSFRFIYEKRSPSERWRPESDLLHPSYSLRARQGRNKNDEQNMIKYMKLMRYMNETKMMKYMSYF